MSSLNPVEPRSSTTLAMGVEQYAPTRTDTDEASHGREVARSSDDGSDLRTVYGVKQSGGLASRLDHAILNLSPAFFSLCMGTGIVSILLYNFPYPAHWLRTLGIIIFVLNIVLFFILTSANLVRYVRWKGLFSAVLLHHRASLFWGTMPMGLVTIVNMIALSCLPIGGVRVARLAVGLWWIDIVLAVMINLGVVFLMVTRQTHTVRSMSAAWLLPIVTCVVAAASGGVVASAVMPFLPRLARSIVLVSYIVWGIGTPLALCVIVIYLYNLILRGAPSAGALPTAFLPLGPCGQGSFGIMILGRTVRALAYEHNIGLAISPVGGDRDALLRTADAVYMGGVICGLILWGLAFCWYTLASAFFVNHWVQNKTYFGPTSFSIGLTSLTFPIGVWATATTTLATELDSPAFRVIGAVISVQVMLNWLYVMIMTVYKLLDGTIFVAPELEAFINRRPPLRWESARSTGNENHMEKDRVGVV